MAKKYQLKNGLKVLLVESHKSPVISVQMWVRTGSADESKKEEGISHFIEHLVFKGTEKYKVGEIAASVEGSGGELNAYTSFDQTVFYVTISKQFVDVGLDVISQMMGFPLFDPQEIDNEREVVIEEIKRGEDSPQRQIAQLLFSTAYKKHPYKIPVIGYAKNIRSLSAKKIKSFFESRYVPKNMFLVVAGDFETPSMKEKVNTFFGKFKDLKLKNIKRVKEPKQLKPQFAVKTTQFQEALTYICFKGPNVKHKDVPGLDVLALIFGQGDSSRLVKALRMDAPIVNSTGAFAFTPQNDGLIAFSGSLDPENLSAFFSKLKEETLKIMTEAPSNEELQKALTNISSEQIYSVESVDGIARKAGSDEFYMGDPEHFKKYLAQLYKLKPSDITKLAKKYFNPQQMSVVVMTKENSKTSQKEAQEIVKKFIHDFKKDVSLIGKKASRVIQVKQKTKAFKSKKLTLSTSLNKEFPKTEIISLDQGVKLYFRQQKETPTCSIRFAFLGGLRTEKDTKGGLVELFSRVWPTGTSKISEEELNHKIDASAAGLSCFSGRNSVGMSADFLTPYSDEMLDLTIETLVDPIWNQEIIGREKLIQINQLQSQQDNPAQVCMIQFMKEIFSGHAYSKEMLGTKESISQLQQEDFRQYHQSIFNPQNLSICAVGDFTQNELIKKLNHLIKQMKPGKKQLFPSTIHPHTNEIRAFKELKKEQTHIVVGYNGLKLGDKDRHTLQVIQSILSGQGGRLFYELRDKNSLAYSVSPIRMEGIEGGYFGAYIGCSPEKSDKAIEMIKIEFNKLCQTKVEPEELLRAQRYLAGRCDIDLQRKSTICNSILFDVIYGLDPDETFKASEKYFQITVEDIMNLSQKLFTKPSVISVVGPSAPKGFLKI